MQNCQREGVKLDTVSYFQTELHHPIREIPSLERFCEDSREGHASGTKSVRWEVGRLLLYKQAEQNVAAFLDVRMERK